MFKEVTTTCIFIDKHVLLCSLVSRAFFEGEEERAWYTLFAHVLYIFPVKAGSSDTNPRGVSKLRKILLENIRKF